MTTVKDALEHLFGDRYDFDDGDLEATPLRWLKMMRELTTPEEFTFTTFPAKSDEMVMVGPISFTSLCGHHLLPFLGNAWVAYVPDKKMAGLSKLARTVRYCAAGLQVQEHLTQEIEVMLNEHLDSLGNAVVLSAEHTCMTIRGVQAAGAQTITAMMSGVFADHERTAKAEFMQYVQMTQPRRR